jgi:vibriolysin
MVRTMKYQVAFLGLCLVGSLTAAGCAAGTTNDSKQDPSGDTPFLTGDLGDFPRDSSADDPGAEERLKALLDTIAQQYGVTSDELKLHQSQEDRYGRLHVVYQQVSRNLPVVGATLAIHVTETGKVYAANGSIRSVQAIPDQPTVSAVTAAGAVTTQYPNATQSDPALVFYAGAGNSALLAWEIEANDPARRIREKVYVDAREGGIVGTRMLIIGAMARKLEDERVDPPVTFTEEVPPQQENHVATFARMERLYNCFSEVFQRDGLDGSGGEFRVVLTNTEDNAYWHFDGNYIEFGVGSTGNPPEDGGDFWAGGFELSEDVLAHEAGHGLMSAVANLQYDWGWDWTADDAALHEGMADITAAICQWHREGRTINANTFALAEDEVFTPSIPDDALRYLDDPAKDGMSLDYYRMSGTEAPHDRGGIIRLAFYLTAMGGHHPRMPESVEVKGIGMEAAAKIFYRAADAYFTERTFYPDARTATLIAAKELYDEETAKSVDDAWRAVGLDGEMPVTPPIEYDEPVVTDPD